MRLTRIPVALVATALMASAAAFGEISSWTSVGPGGGIVGFVAVAPSDPAIVYAATSEGGIFVSANGGIDWYAATAGLTNFNVQCVAVSPVDARTAYVGTTTGGFQTVNRGASWTPLGGGFPASVINSIVIDPAHPATVYAAGTAGDVVKSTNGGATWSGIAGSVAAELPRILAIDPGATSTLYLGTLNSGVYRSDDGGAHWTARNTSIENGHVTALAIDPTNPSRVYAGFSGGGVFRTTDGGATWSAFNVGIDPSALVSSLVVAADGTAYVCGRIATGLKFLAPGSDAWGPIAFFSEFPVALAVGPGATPPLFIGYGNLPFDPGGVARWEGESRFILNNVTAVTVSTIAVDPSTPGRALAGTPAGVFTYDASLGYPWSDVSLAAGLPSVFLFDTQFPGTVYAGGVRGVWKSTDGGVADWATALTGLPDTQPPIVVRALAAVPGTPGGIFAGTSQGLFVTANGAATWSAGSADLAGKPVYSLASDPSVVTVLWAGTDDGVYRSANSGQSWSRAGAPIGATVRQILGPAGSSRVFAATDSGLYVSGDAGANWARVGGGLPAAAVNSVIEDPPRATLLAGTLTGVYQSVDGGLTWSAAGALANPNVLCLAVFPDGTVLAGTKGGSVYRSAPAGADRGAVARPAAPPSPRALLPRR